MVKEHYNEKVFHIDENHNTRYIKCRFIECTFYISINAYKLAIDETLPSKFFKECKCDGCSLVVFQPEVYDLFVSIKTKNDALLNLKHEHKAIREKCEDILYEKDRNPS